MENSDCVWVEKITKRVLNRTILDKFDFVFYSGHTYAMLGRNGSGKSTCMKILSGNTKPNGGQIVYFGDKLRPEFKENIAYLPPGQVFYSYMRIDDVAKYMSDFFTNFDKEIFYKIISDLKLDRRSKLLKLSTGEYEKVKIASVFSRKCSIYLLDEPFNGLDTISKEYTYNLIKEKKKEKKLIIITSHIMEGLEQIIDDYLILDKGRLAYSDTYREGEKTLEESYLETIKEGE